MLDLRPNWSPKRAKKNREGQEEEEEEEEEEEKEEGGVKKVWNYMEF